MILYLTLVSIGLCAFWTYFIAFLKHKTFFKANRFFLLLGLLVSFLAPLGSYYIPAEAIFTLTTFPETFSENVSIDIVEHTKHLGNEIKEVSLRAEQNYSQWFFIFYGVGFSVMLIRLTIGLIKIVKLYLHASAETIKDKPVYQHKFINQPFTLFGSIHIPESWGMTIPDEIFNHEKEHIEKWHFFDLLLVEIACLILWFNPIIHFYRKSIQLNLEYLADQYVIDKGADVPGYQSILLSMTLSRTHEIPLKINFATPLKNRIQMMNKPKSNSWSRIALLGVIPLSVMLMALNTKKALQISIKNGIGSIIEISAPGERPEGLPIKKNQLTKLSSLFGMRVHPIDKEKVLHKGIDIVAKMGTPVYATASGFVEVAKFDEKHGYYVKLSHSEKYQTQYSHLKNFVVIKNALVTKGQLIGYVGNSGESIAPHLHYEVHLDGEAVDPKQFMDDC